MELPLLSVSNIGQNVKTNNFYAYVHCRPDGIPFYVGKGIRNRANKLITNRNKYHQHVVNKHGEENILIGKIECSSEVIAFELEKGMIKCFKRSGIKLTNMTDGGDGISGLKHSKESKIKMSNSQKNRIHTPEEIAKMQKTMKGKPLSEKHKESLRGRKFSQKHKENLSIALKKSGCKPTKDAILKAAKAKQTDEFREKQSLRMKEYYKLNPHKVKGFNPKPIIE